MCDARANEDLTMMEHLEKENPQTKISKAPFSHTVLLETLRQLHIIDQTAMGGTI